MKKHNKIKILPKTSLGKWSVISLILSFLLFLFANIIVALQGPIENQTFFNNPFLSIPMVLAGISVITGFFTGIISIIWKKERAILVFISTFIGLVVLWFIVGEIAVPH